MRRIFLFLNTIKYLKPSQIFRRFTKNFVKVYSLNEDFSVNKIYKQPYFIQNLNPTSDGKICFLNHYESLDKYIFKKKYKSKLWDFNLNYFDYLISTIENKDCDKLIKNWISYNLSRFNRTAWHPYPSSLRSVNWIKFYLLNEKKPDYLTKALYQHGEIIFKRIEYDVLGNHLIKNLKALIFLGCFFKSQRALLWLESGMRNLKSELDIQILDDGLHFEKTPSYHNQVLEDLVEIKIILECYSIKYDSLMPELDKSISMMLFRSKNLNHPDGKIAFFNDSTFNMSKNYSDIKLLMEKNSILLKEIETESENFLSKTIDNLFFILNISSISGSYQPGHSHADNLSFEFSYKRKRLFVNTGISTYEPGEKRKYQRSSIAHNMLTFDEKNTSEVWSNFRVARRVSTIYKIIENNETKLSIEGGYSDLNGNKAARKFIFSDQKLIIEDTAYSPSISYSYFHLHPSITITKMQDGVINFQDKESNLIASLTHTHRDLKVIDSKWCESFGLELENRILRFTLSNNNPQTGRIEVQFNP